MLPIDAGRGSATYDNKGLVALVVVVVFVVIVAVPVPKVDIGRRLRKSKGSPHMDH